jgi:hypothetical protein
MGDIGIQRHQTIAQWSDRGRVAAHELNGGLNDRVLKAGRVRIQALAQAGGGGRPLQGQGLQKKRVGTNGVDRLEVAYAQTQQRDIAGEDVTMRHRIASLRSADTAAASAVRLVRSRMASPISPKPAWDVKSAVDFEMISRRIVSPTGEFY